MCHNFNRGFCRWGNACRFSHDSARNTGNNSGTNRNSSSQAVSFNWAQQQPALNGLGCQQQLLSLLQTQNALLAQCGLSSNAGLAQLGATVPSGSVLGSRPNIPLGFTSVTNMQPTQTFTPQQQALYTRTVNGSAPQSIYPVRKRYFLRHLTP